MSHVAGNIQTNSAHTVARIPDRLPLFSANTWEFRFAHNDTNSGYPSAVMLHFPRSKFCTHNRSKWNLGFIFWTTQCPFATRVRISWKLGKIQSRCGSGTRWITIRYSPNGRGKTVRVKLFGITARGRNALGLNAPTSDIPKCGYVYAWIAKTMRKRIYDTNGFCQPTPPTLEKCCLVRPG